MQLETVGEMVRVLRSRRDLEQVELARTCGWRDASAVSRIETDRVRPTRRTLLKLAQSLADPSVTGSVSEVRAWLFLAAGILPIARDIDELGDRIPDIDRLPYAARVMDFGGYVWRANEWFIKGVGLPNRFIGRNYLEMFFEDGGTIRSHLGDLWSDLAPVVVAKFRSETARRREQRWFVQLMTRLQTLPDFERLWNKPVRLSRDTFNWSHISVDGGMVSAVQSQLTADPRLIVHAVIPEDANGRDQMGKYGALAGPLW